MIIWAPIVIHDDKIGEWKKRCGSEVFDGSTHKQHWRVLGHE